MVKNKKGSSIYTSKFSPTQFKDDTTYNHILNFIDIGDRAILDIGCSSGYLGAEIKKNHPRTVVVGIDNSKNDLKLAKTVLDKTIQIDLNHFDHTKIDQKFDLIILADVIEHLIDPNPLLTKLPSLLKKNGRIIISIPNFSHYSVITKLLSHQWQYDDFGLLDRTHVHFYDYNSIINLLRSHNFNIDRIDIIQSKPTLGDQVSEMFKIGLPLSFRLYKKIYNQENLVFQYIFVLSASSEVSSEAIFNKQKILDQFKYSIYNRPSFYFYSLLLKIKSLVKSFLNERR